MMLICWVKTEEHKTPY